MDSRTIWAKLEACPNISGYNLPNQLLDDLSPTSFDNLEIKACFNDESIEKAEQSLVNGETFKVDLSQLKDKINFESIKIHCENRGIRLSPDLLKDVPFTPVIAILAAKQDVKNPLISRNYFFAYHAQNQKKRVLALSYPLEKNNSERADYFTLMPNNSIECANRGQGQYSSLCAIAIPDLLNLKQDDPALWQSVIANTALVIFIECAVDASEKKGFHSYYDALSIKAYVASTLALDLKEQHLSQNEKEKLLEKMHYSVKKLGKQLMPDVLTAALDDKVKQEVDNSLSCVI